MTIQRPSDAMGPIFWHAPQAPVPINTPIVVGEHECVVASLDGAILGVIPTGSHWMHPQPFPFLSRCIDPQSNIRAELWFVTTARVEGIKCGGSLGEVLDAQTEVHCSPRAIFGFSVKVTDPLRLVNGVMSQSMESDGLIEWVKAMVMKKAKETLAHYAMGGGSLLGPKLSAELSAEIPKLTDLDVCGLQIAGVGDVMMNFSQDDITALKQASVAKAAAKREAMANAQPAAQLRCGRCGVAHAGGRFCTSCGAPLQNA